MYNTLRIVTEIAEWLSQIQLPSGFIADLTTPLLGMYPHMTFVQLYTFSWRDLLRASQ